jgi:exosome complex RNA-binding protein Rrp4
LSVYELPAISKQRHVVSNLRKIVTKRKNMILIIKNQTMKKIILVLVGILIISCSKESETKYSTDSQKVFLIITENTTESELTKIASDFKTEKI